MTWIGFAVAAPIFAASVIAMGMGAMESFEGTYMGTLCRIESVRVNALEQLENDEPLTADFGGDECLPENLPTLEVAVEIVTPEPTLDPTLEPTPTG